MSVDVSWKHVVLSSNNNPTVSWVQQMASCSSFIAEQLIRLIALQFNIQKVSPITTLHIAGDQNAMKDITYCSFGSKPKWHFQYEEALITFINSTSLSQLRTCGPSASPPPQ
jgi:hypothetical protein